MDYTPEIIVWLVFIVLVILVPVTLFIDNCLTTPAERAQQERERRARMMQDIKLRERINKERKERFEEYVGYIKSRKL